MISFFNANHEVIIKWPTKSSILKPASSATLTLEEAAALVQLDPHEIEWAIEEHGVCETETHQITKLAEPPEGDGEGDDDDAGDGDSISPLPVFVYISLAEFEAHLAQQPANVIRLKWDEPIVREAVEARRDDIAAQLRSDENGPMEPSAVFHLTREEIALIR